MLFWLHIKEEIKRREEVEHIVTNDGEEDKLIFDNANYESDMDDLNVFDNNEEEEREM